MPRLGISLFAAGAMFVSAAVGADDRSGLAELNNPVTLKGAGFVLEVGADGGMHVVRDGQVFGIESRFSYAGQPIGWNVLGPQADNAQHAAWQIERKAQDARSATISAACPAYAVERSIVVDGPRIRVRERIKNTAMETIGVILQHSITAPKPFGQALVSGVPTLSQDTIAENPTIFVQGETANLGFVAEDNLLRLQMATLIQPNRVLVKAEHVGVDVGREYTFEWTLYPLDQKSDYWTLVNQIRADWGVQFTITGPWSFFDVQRNAALIKNPTALRAYLQRKNLKIVALAPWIDYENYDVDEKRLVTREKYKRLMTEAARAFRAADPAVKVTGCMESFPISLSLEDSRTLRDRLPPDQQKQGYPVVTRELLQGLGSLSDRDKDALLMTPEDRPSVELYYRGASVPLVALLAYPAPGNAQHDRLLEQARFLKEECGLDGIYIDSFTVAFNRSSANMRYDYSKWDGQTVDVDAATGRVLRKYTDAAYAGARSRAALIEYVLQHDGVFVANMYPVCREEQALPAFRFSEPEWCFNPLDQKKGEKPPLFDRMCQGHLTTPIGLGYRPDRLRPHDADKYAWIIMKTVVTYLRFGGLMYHYETEIPTEGPASGEYGPINHMFPITPVELREGAMIGKERIVTAVSGVFRWLPNRKPTVLVFDMTGRPTEAPVTVEQEDGAWRVSLKLQDWEQIGVIE